MKIQKYSSIQVFNVKARDPVAFINIWDYTSSALVLSDLNIIFECCSICLLLRTRMFAMRAGKFWRRVRHCWDVSRPVPSAECLLSVVTLRCVVTSSHITAPVSHLHHLGQWPVYSVLQWPLHSEPPVWLPTSGRHFASASDLLALTVALARILALKR